MKLYFALIISLILTQTAFSQPMNIYSKSGKDTSFQITEIDSITFSNQSVTDSIVLHDDFESQPLFTFPELTGWKLFAYSSTQRTTVQPGTILLENKYKNSGQKSFRVSAPSGFGAYVNNRLKRTPDTVTFDVKIFMEKYPDSAFAESSCWFGFWNLSESIGGENYAGLVIRQNGNVSCRIGTKESQITKLDKSRWYIIRVRFDTRNREMSVWINLQPVVPKFSGILPSFGYKDFTIHAINSEVYFDDLKIWESE